MWYLIVTVPDLYILIYFYTGYQAGVPMERVHIDYLGPLPKTNKDNEHLLMMVDQFTKWVKVIPVASQTTELTAQTLVSFGVHFKVWISVSDILRPGAELRKQVVCRIM